jgi:hypothetical protein
MMKRMSLKPVKETSTFPPSPPIVVESRTTDKKSRLVLPKDFASATVVVERVSDTELRIRKAQVIPEDEIQFVEDARAPLSNKDRDIFLALLDDPPKPNQALRDAFAEYNTANAKVRGRSIRRK